MKKVKNSLSNGIDNILKPNINVINRKPEKCSFSGKNSFSEISDNFQIKKTIKKRGKRGPYRKYDEETKKKAVKMAERLNDPSGVALLFKVPLKNLKRWMKNGYKRKKGGRKTKDPKMEAELIEWIEGFYSLNQRIPEQKIIKKMALHFSNFEDFKASKGWYEKFMIRMKKSK